MSNQIPEDEYLYNAKLNDIGPTSIQQFPPLIETSKIQVSVSGRLLSEGFSKVTEAEIAEIVRKELTSRKVRSPLEGKPGLDISLKSLDFRSLLEDYLADTISKKVQKLLAVKQSPKDAMTDDDEFGEIRQPLHGPGQGPCICAGNLPGSEYPVIDPHSVAGPLPHVYAIGFYEDWIRMKVEEDPSLSGCQMLVGLESRVSWAKEIAGWHLCNAQVSSVSTSGSNTGPNFMLLEKAECQSGVHTILFKKAKLFAVMTGMYTLDMNTFWPLLGGKKVTFTWILDTQGSGKWGHESSFSSGRDDGTLLKGESDPIFVMFGGAKFHIPSPTVFEAMGFDWANVQTVSDNAAMAVPDVPRDGTLLRESSGAIYVMFGGAKFHIPNMNEFNALFSPANVRQLWDGALTSIPNVPRDGTLLTERTSPGPVFVFKGGSKFHISSPARFHELCFYWENLRIVPNGALAAFPVSGVL